MNKVRSMTPEAVDKAIQFLPERQAAFEASLLKGQELFNERWARTQTQIDSTQSLVNELGKKVSEIAKQINELAKKTQASSEQIDSLSEQIGSLKDACRELLEHSGYTDFRLNRLESRDR